METTLKVYITVPGNRMAGLMSYFVQAVSNLKAVESTTNKMYIKYDHNMLYLDNSKSIPNVWDYYFHQPFDFTEEEIKNCIKIKDVWFEEGLGIPSCRPSKEFYIQSNKLINKHVKPKDHVLAKIDKFLVENDLSDDNFLAVHKRGTDYHTIDLDHILTSIKTTISIENFFKNIDPIVDRFKKLLICSDEQQPVESFKRRYGDKVVYYNSIRSNDNAPVGIHNRGIQDRYKLGEDIIIETYLMSKAHTLVRTVSNVSISVIMLNNDINTINIDKDIEYDK